jgi:hypothetical protein
MLGQYLYKIHVGIDFRECYLHTNEVAKGYGNPTVRPSVASLWTL